MSFEAQASGGSYTLNWYAADPAVNFGPYLPTYAKLPPSSLACPGSAGRYAAPLANAVLYGSSYTPANLDGVTSLAPSTLILGQVVPFEMHIKVNGETTPENGVIRFTTNFYTNSTSGGNFGFDPNYMIYCAFVDTADPGTVDSGTSAKVDSYTSTLLGSGATSRIAGTFQISGLESGDNVVVEIWVVLKSRIPAGSTGNVQTNLASANTGSGESIPTGSQNVPLLRVQEFFSSSADISVTKTDSPDPVIQGDQLTYSLIVKNNAASTTANGVVVTDTLSSSTSFVSASGAPYTTSGNTITFNVGGLSPGESKTLSIVSSVSNTAPTGNDTTTTSEAGGTSRPTLFDIYNKASVTATTADGITTNNIYYQPTNVLAPNPSLSLSKKISTSSTGPWSSSVSVDGNAPVYYQFTITNTGNVPLTSLSITDPTVSTSSITWPSSLAAGETATGVVGPVTTETLAGTYSNTATASGSYRGVVYPSGSATASYIIHPVPELTLHKEISTSSTGPWSSAINVNGGTSVYYRFTITNTGNVPLTSLSITDPTVSTSSITWPASLAVGDTATGVVGPITTQTSSGTYSNTATASGSYGTETSVSLPSSASYAINQVASLSLEKEISTSSSGPWSYMTTVDAGTAVYYRFTITNTGSVPLTSLSITDPAVSTSSIIWPSSLAVGGTTTGVVGPITAGSLAGTYSNTATASGNYESQTYVSTPTSASYVIIPLPSLSLEKKISTSATGPWSSSINVASGTPVYYQFTITNTGNVPLTSFTISDPTVSTSSITWPASLAVGGTATGVVGPITAEGLADTYNNTATASGIYESETYTSAPSSASYVVAVVPSLTLDKKISTSSTGPWSSSISVSSGTPVYYQFTITNTGNVPLTSLSITDPTVSTASITWPALLAVGGTATGVVGPIAAQNVSGTYTNTATAGGSYGGETYTSAPSSASYIVPPVPSLTLNKMISTSSTGPWSSTVSVDGNAPVYYQFTITNTGNVPLTSLSITDPTVSTSSITWPDSLAVGETATGVVGPITTETSSGTYSNTATASGSYGGVVYSSISSSASYIIHPVPLLTLHKEISTSSSGPWSSTINVNGGTSVYYKFSITNTGNVPLTSLSITDPTVSTSSIMWPASLAVGETATGVVGPITTQTSSGTYSNTATASGSYGTETSVSLPSSASYAINQVASLSLEKEISTSSSGPWSYMITPDAGTAIYYRFTITNTGSVPLTSLSITDPAVSTSSITWPSSLAVGGTATGIVGPVTAASLEGTYINTATASGNYETQTYVSTPTSASYVIIPLPSLSLEKKISTSATGPWSSSINVASSTPVYYQFTITNTGNVPLTSLSITDPTVSTSSITWPASLAVGETTTGVVGPITAESLAGTYSNTAIANGIYQGMTFVSAPSSADYVVSTYMYDFDPNPPTCGTTVTLTITSTAPDGLSLLVICKNNNTMFYAAVVEKSSGVYTCAIPIPPSLSGDCSIEITEYSSSGGTGTIVGQDTDTFQVICEVPEFPVGSSMFLLITGVGYFGIRKKWQGF